MPRRPPVAAALALLAVLPAGCSGSTDTDRTPVRVPAAGLPTAALVRACGALVAGLPDELDPGVRRRPVTPVTGRTAAWGTPAVVLRCGVAAGSAADQPFATDGVRWAVHTTGGGQVWTTVGRTVNISVAIPAHYDAQAELAISLAPVVTATLPGPGAGS